MSEFKTMLNIKNLIATVLFSGVAAVSFAQAPVATKDAATTAPATSTVPAATTKHVAKKVEVPAVKKEATVAAEPAEAASKPALTTKKMHNGTPAKKADVAAPAVPATK